MKPQGLRFRQTSFFSSNNAADENENMAKLTFTVVRARAARSCPRMVRMHEFQTMLLCPRQCQHTLPPALKVVRIGASSQAVHCHGRGRQVVRLLVHRCWTVRSMDPPRPRSCSRSRPRHLLSCEAVLFVIRHLPSCTLCHHGKEGGRLRTDGLVLVILRLP